MLRSTLLPFDDFVAWGEGLDAPKCANEPRQLEEAIHADWQRLRQRLSAIVLRPEVREALFLASPDLAVAVDRWNEQPDKKQERRVERSLVRYYARMCGRSTPFGMFAGYAVGHTGDRTRLTVGPRHSCRRHMRLDMDYLCSLIDAVAADPQIEAHLRFRPNSSLYHAAGRLRYFESRTKEKSRSYHLVAVEETDYLNNTLEGAGTGATADELARELVDDEVTLDDARGYVHELIASQLLVPDLTPRATGPEPIHAVINELQGHPASRTIADRLDEVRHSLEAMAEKPPGIQITEYKAIAERLEELPTKVELGKLIQVDMVRPSDTPSLGADVFDEIERAVLFLHSIRTEAQADDLAKFREAFRERYEDRVMPLFQVLDEENGIGFGDVDADASPLPDALQLPAGQTDSRVTWRALDSFLLSKLHETARANTTVLNIDSKDVVAFSNTNGAAIADSFAVMAKLAAKSEEALDAGDFQIKISSISPSSGAALFGRFCHGDMRLLEHVKRYLESEEMQRSDTIFAEVVHLPEGRIGNVILRPTLRAYEIPFLGRAAVPEDFQIPVSDLLVSIEGNSIVLQSKRLRKRVIPRLSNAHNFRRGLGIYRFLCSLQYQDVGNLGWSWGALESARFLPRVVVGRVVLSPARWRVDKIEIEAASSADEPARYAAIQEWRQKHGIPRFIVLADGDNTLPIDLDNVLCVDTLVEFVKKRSEFRIEEFYPAPDELGASGPEGRYVHEIVVPMTVKRENPPSVPTHISTDTDVQLLRTFAPGSEWLFAKIYTGKAGADQLLQEVVSPVVSQVLADGSADRWFFLRYGDPKWHLRLRFHGDSDRLSAAVLPRLHAACAPLIRNGLLWKIELGTYEREIERYGDGELMLFAESLFQIDSEAVLTVLAELSTDAALDTRWRVALRGVDQLLDDLGFDFDKKLDIVSMSWRSALAEIGAPRALEHQCASRFRNERKSLEGLLDRANDASGPFASALAALNARSQRIRPLAAAVREKADAALPLRLESLAASYIHMHTNRMLRSAAKAQELVIYDFLVRLYSSQRARRRS